MAPGSPSPSTNNDCLATAEKVNLDAFVPTELANIASQNEKGTIESILAYGDKLLLGLSTGALQVYTVENPFGPSPQATLSKVYKTFSSRPIEKLALLKDAGCLIVLAEGIVSVFDLETYSLDEKLIKTKGATTFAITSGVRNLDDGVPVMISRLLVACKSRLVCYEWRDAEFTEYKELHLHDRIKTITFVNHDKAVCGLASDYCVVDVPTSTISSIVLPGSHDTSYAVLGMSYIGMGGRHPTPHSVKLPNNTALLVRDTTSQCIDTTGQLLDKPVIPWAVAPEALGFSYPFLFCILPKLIEIRNPDTFNLLQTVNIPGVRCMNDGKLAYISTSTQVYRLLCTDFKELVGVLADQDTQLSEAISLLTLIDPAFIENKESLLRELQIRKAVQMFKRKEYMRSMLLFSDISAPPKTVIDLFPSQISGTAEDLIEATGRLFPDPSSQSSTPLRRSSISSQTTRTLGGASSVGTPPLRHSASENSSTEPEPNDGTLQPTPWTNGDLALAIRSLLNYLADTRRKISSLSVSEKPVMFQGVELAKDIYGDLGDAATLVDTTLFKCYIIRSPALLGPLLRIHNHCDSHIVRTVLSKAGKWRELIDFYFAKQLHKDALDLLYSLGTTEQASASFLEGPEPTVRYLQRLNNEHLPLIFEFATWPISVKEEYGADIFLEDSTESESLDRKKVLSYLEAESPSLTIQYLEHLIHEKDDGSTLFHTALAIAYVKVLAQSKESSTSNEIFNKLTSLLKAKPSYYRIERVLSSLPKKTESHLLLEVKAILCGQRGQHKEALEIYTFQIGDSLKARTYCSELYDRDVKVGRAALHALMGLYLTPPHRNQQQRLDLALDLLSSQGSRMSVVEIINTLPNSTSIHDLAVFLTSQIRTLKKSWNAAELDTSLRKVHLVKTQEALLDKQQRSVTITNLKTCRVCFKRLGHSVISVFPNGTAIHYGCARAYQQMLDEETNKSKEDKLKRSSKATTGTAVGHDGKKKEIGLRAKPSLTNLD